MSLCKAIKHLQHSRGYQPEHFFRYHRGSLPYPLLNHFKKILTLPTFWLSKKNV